MGIVSIIQNDFVTDAIIDVDCGWLISLPRHSLCIWPLKWQANADTACHDFTLRAQPQVRHIHNPARQPLPSG